jgi:hypothetical protein
MQRSGQHTLACQKIYRTHKKCFNLPHQFLVLISALTSYWYLLYFPLYITSCTISLPSSSPVIVLLFLIFNPSFLTDNFSLVKNPVVVTLSDEESDPDLGLYSPATSPDIIRQVKIQFSGSSFWDIQIRIRYYL